MAWQRLRSKKSSGERHFEIRCRWCILTFMRTVKSLWFLIAAVLVSGCASAPMPVERPLIPCRLGHRSSAPMRTISILSEADLDTRSKDAAAYTFDALINNGRRLSASVRHVDILMPRERFNVALALDGVTYMRLNHIDLDIYIETSIDGEIYLLHCLREP